MTMQDYKKSNKYLRNMRYKLVVFGFFYGIVATCII